MLSILLFACIEDLSRPNAGNCSNTPDGMHEFGQIAIGTCLAGPTKIHLIERESETSDTDSEKEVFWDLYVVNSNPYLSFTSGSLQHIRWEDIDLDDPIQFTDEVTNTALPLPSFAYDLSTLEHSDGTITSFVGTRLSEGSRTKEQDDYVYLFDVTESTPRYDNKGQFTFPNLDISENIITQHLIESEKEAMLNSTQNAVQVKEDPLGISTHKSTGRVFVNNHTSGNISMLNASTDEVFVEAPRLQGILSQAYFTDIDDDNMQSSTASMVDFSRITQDMLLEQDAEIPPLTDDFWTLTWMEGSWRFWLNSSDGYFQAVSFGGDPSLSESNLGVELSTESLFGSGIQGNITDAFYFDGLMYFIFQGNIHYAYWNTSLVQWEYLGLVLNEENTLQSPSITVALPEDINDEIETGMLFYVQNKESIFMSSYDFANNQVSNSEEILHVQQIIEDVVGLEQENSDMEIRNSLVRYDSLTSQWILSLSFFDGLQWVPIIYRSTNLQDWEYDSHWNIPTPSIAELIVGTNLEDIEETDLLIHKAGVTFSFESDRIRVWYTCAVTSVYPEEEVLWYLFYSDSFDGINFSVPKNIWDSAFEGSLDSFPEWAFQAYPTGNFRLEGESAGAQERVLEVTKEYAPLQFGWKTSVLVGAYKDEHWFAANSAGGLQIDSILWDRNLAYLTIEDEAGFTKIAVAEQSIEGEWIARNGNILNTDQSVSSPVVWKENETYRMIFRQVISNNTSNNTFVIKEATSDNGIDWDITDQSHFTEAESWFSDDIHPSSIFLSQDGETVFLLFSAFDGRSWQIGLAERSEGKWNLVSEQPIVSAGYPGDWNDSGVKDPYLLLESVENGYVVHLWYAGFDGTNWQIGYMHSDVTIVSDSVEELLAVFESSFSHPQNVLQEKMPILSEKGLFYTSGIQKPIPFEIPAHFTGNISNQIPIGNGFRFFFSAEHDDIKRIGRATSTKPDRARVHYQSLDAGDTLSFFTRYGAEEEDSIVIRGTYDDIMLTGYLPSDSVIDEEEGFLYLVSTSSPYIVIIDIQNDGHELDENSIESVLQGDTPDEILDRNYLGVEGIITAKTAAGAIGFRDVLIHTAEDGTKILYAINDAPEAVFSFDITHITDVDTPVVYDDIQIGYLVAEMGVERDADYNTQQSVGPGQMALHPNGTYLAVSHFNANSVTMFDLQRGYPLTEWSHIGENPYALTFTPDGNHLIVTTYTGDFDEAYTKGQTNFGLASSTLWIYDTNPNSSSYLQVQTKIQNK